MGFKGTWYDFLPEGWRKAFGQELLDDMRKALKQDHLLHKIHIVDMKEKYGDGATNKGLNSSTAYLGSGTIV